MAVAFSSGAGVAETYFGVFVGYCVSDFVYNQSDSLVAIVQSAADTYKPLALIFCFILKRQLSLLKPRCPTSCVHVVEGETGFDRLTQWAGMWETAHGSTGSPRTVSTRTNLFF